MTAPLSAYQTRAANSVKPASHEADVARLLAPEDLVEHDTDTAQWLSATAANYFADWSEYQQVVNSSYAYPIRMFRCHSGYRTDTHAAANWADTEASLAAGVTRVAFTYPVFVPGQLSVVMAGIKNLFGAVYPTKRLVPVIDMESGAGFAGPGNHSAEANEWAYTLAEYSGTPVDLIRSHGYANKPDYQSCWPQIDIRIPRHTADYSATSPGSWAWQYQGGNPAYAAPAGAPRSYAPFGTFIDGNVIYDTIANIEHYLGITTLVPPLEDDMIFVLLIDPATVPGNQTGVPQGDYTTEGGLHWLADGESASHYLSGQLVTTDANGTRIALSPVAPSLQISWQDLRNRAIEKYGPGGMGLFPTGTDFGAGTGTVAWPTSASGVTPSVNGASWVPMPGTTPSSGGTGTAPTAAENAAETVTQLRANLAADPLTITATEKGVVG